MLQFQLMALPPGQVASDADKYRPVFKIHSALAERLNDVVAETESIGLIVTFKTGAKVFVSTVTDTDPLAQALAIIDDLATAQTDIVNHLLQQVRATVYDTQTEQIQAKPEHSDSAVGCAGAGGVSPAEKVGQKDSQTTEETANRASYDPGRFVGIIEDFID